MVECPKLVERAANGLALRIEHGGLEGNEYASLHTLTLLDLCSRPALRPPTHACVAPPFPRLIGRRLRHRQAFGTRVVQFRQLPP